MIAYTNKIKIIYYIPQLTIGGTERHLFYLVKHLEKQKYVPVVWCPGPWGDIGNELLKLNIEVVTYKISFQLLDLFLYLKRNKFDIFHSYGYGTHCFDAVIAKLAGIPIYITSRRNMRHWAGGDKLHTTERIRNYFSEFVIANSEAVKNRASRIEKMPSEKIRTIYNGISLSNIKLHSLNGHLKKELGIPRDNIVIGSIANLKPVKGQKYLVEAFNKIAGKRNHTSLVLVGDGPEKENLLKTAEILGIKDRIFIRHSYRHVFDFLNMIDIFVLPSLSEGFSNALLEAMVMSKPVIATKTGGNSELICDNKTGLLVEPGNADALADAVLSLIDDVEYRNEIGKNAGKRTMECFSLEAMVNQFEAVYKNLLINKKSCKI